MGGPAAVFSSEPQFPLLTWTEAPSSVTGWMGGCLCCRDATCCPALREKLDLIFQAHGSRSEKCFCEGKGVSSALVPLYLPKASTGPKQLLARVNTEPTGCQNHWVMGPCDFMRFCSICLLHPCIPGISTEEPAVDSNKVIWARRALSPGTSPHPVLSRNLTPRGQCHTGHWWLIWNIKFCPQ